MNSRDYGQYKACGVFRAPPPSSFHADDERRPIVEIPHVEDMAVPERDAEPSDGGLGAQRLLQRAITERDLASGIYASRSLAENVGRALVWPHGTIRRRSRSGRRRPGCGQPQPGRAARHGGRRSRFGRGRAARGRKSRQVEPLRMAQSRRGPAAAPGPGRRIQRDPGGADARCAQFPGVADERYACWKRKGAPCRPRSPTAWRSPMHRPTSVSTPRR